ncbi:MAG TPA: transcriptional regulator [Caulobacteraceae bacterium]
MDDFDIGGIDEVIHGRLRLGIMAYLAGGGGGAADFTELKSRLQASDGNLSVHLRKLEEAGYVAIDKSFVGRKPLTTVRLTPPGRKAFLAYLEEIGRLVDSGPKGVDPSDGPS